MPKNNEAQLALQKVINKSRVHFYKPFQIAEILFRHRIEEGWNLNDLESYRNVSKRWRDDISLRLVGRRSTSSQKYQDNIFEANAMPPRLLAALGQINKEGKGFVEAYIYRSFQYKLALIHEAAEYINNNTPSTFSLKELFSLFTKQAGLRRSIDKAYEISVYALFSTLVRALRAEVTLEVKNEDKEILNDFEQFISVVLGINSKRTKITSPAALFRLGVTNAADRGLDMWTNFGAAVQVKHLTLTPDDIEDIAEDIRADRIVIVCVEAEKRPIESLLKQVGWSERIQGIITLNDLDSWYNLCLSKKYVDRLGGTLLADLGREFAYEFPSTENIVPFLKERGYDAMALPAGWEIH